MPEFPEARIRTRSGLEWADQKTVQEAWSQASDEVREFFAGQVASVSDVDLVGVCEDFVGLVTSPAPDPEPALPLTGGPPPRKPRKPAAG